MTTLEYLTTINALTVVMNGMMNGTVGLMTSVENVEHRIYHL